jgi:hypothetical protein
MSVILVDPNCKHLNMSRETLENSLGFIPNFIDETLNYNSMVREALERYGFGMSEMKGHTIDENLTMKYPGDPDLDPIAVIVTCDAQVVIYKYGITSFIKKENGKSVTYRLD